MNVPIRTRVPIILCLLVGVAFPGIVSAWSDTFTSYDGEFLIVDETSLNGWQASQDASSIVNSSLLKNDGKALSVNVDVSKSERHEATITKIITPINGSTYAAKGKMYVWFDPSESDGIISVTLRIGNSPEHYVEYTNTNPNGYGWNDGAQIVEYTLNQPTKIIGTPLYTISNWLQVTVKYASYKPSFSFALNRIWLEKDPNATKGNWVVPLWGGKKGGWSLPGSSLTEGKYLSLTDNELDTLGQHGRVFNKQITNKSYVKYTMESEVNIVESDWGVRMFTQLSDGFNFISGYMSTSYNKVGIEQYIDNVRYYKEVPMTVSKNKYYTLKMVVNGSLATLYVDGVKKVDFTLPQPQTLSVGEPNNTGMESYKGTIHLRQYSFTEN